MLKESLDLTQKMEEVWMKGLTVVEEPEGETLIQNEAHLRLSSCHFRSDRGADGSK